MPEVPDRGGGRKRSHPDPDNRQSHRPKAALDMPVAIATEGRRFVRVILYRGGFGWQQRGGELRVVCQAVYRLLLFLQNCVG